MLGICILVPIILFTYGLCNRNNLNDEKFSKKVGAFVEGTKNDDPVFAKSALLIAMIYFARRLVLCLTLVFWQEFFWA